MPRAARPCSTGSLESEHRPDQPLDLDEEHRQSLDAINHLHAALDRLCGLVLDVAQERSIRSAGPS